MIAAALSVALGLLSPLTAVHGSESGYWRPSWPPVEGCLNVREALLLDRGQAVLDLRRCTVLGGVFPDDWARDAFAGSWADVDVEHLVPAKVLWDRWVDHYGAAPAKDRWVEIFAMPSNLWLTRASTNRSRGARGPHEWCPPSRTARRRAAIGWRFVLFQLDLPTTPAEELGLAAWEDGRCLSD